MKADNIKITMLDPNKLTPWDKNPRDNTKAIIEVAESIARYGFNQPILIDQNHRICVGHTRREAAISLGMSKIPCIVKKMTDQEFIQYNLADNKTGEIADWDEKLLQEIMLSMAEGEIDIPGFNEHELDEILFSDEKDDSSESSGSKRSSKEATKMVFNCTAKQAMEIDSKLDAIIREHELDNQTEALIFALKKFKGANKVKRVRLS
jgi:hypothetical protein